MSDTTTPPEPLVTGQNIIALGVLAIVAGTVAAVFAKADAPTINVIAGTVIGTGLGSVTGFYFGSSRSSQQKDATNAAQATTIAAQAVAPLQAQRAETITEGHIP